MKGIYTWRISVPLQGTGTTDPQVVNRIQKIDQLLKDTFEFAKKSYGRSKNFDMLS